MWEFQIYKLAESGFSRKTSDIWQFGSKFLIWKNIHLTSKKRIIENNSSNSGTKLSEHL